MVRSAGLHIQPSASSWPHFMWPVVLASETSTIELKDLGRADHVLSPPTMSYRYDAILPAATRNFRSAYSR